MQEKEVDEYHCVKCGTEFTIGNVIIKEGKKAPCPKCGSSRTYTRLTKKGYKCRTCGNEFLLSQKN